MKNSIIATLLCGALVCIGPASTARARTDDFDAVVKVIEQHYHVKHKGIPFLARAGMTTAKAAARLAGGQKRRLAEAGSVKVAYFEDQDFAVARSCRQLNPARAKHQYTARCLSLHEQDRAMQG